MSDEYLVSDEDINQAATALATKAEELEAAAAALSEAVPIISADATAFQSTYQPDGIHRARLTELVEFIDAVKDNARATIASMRSMAQRMADFVEANAETQRRAAEDTENIDVEGLNP